MQSRAQWTGRVATLVGIFAAVSLRVSLRQTAMWLEVAHSATLAEPRTTDDAIDSTMSPVTALIGVLLGPVRPYEGPDGVIADPGLEGPALAVVEAAPVAAAEPELRDREAASPHRATGHRDAALAAPQPPPSEPPRNWAVGGFIDTGYTFDHNQPDSHVDRGNFTSVRVNEITVHLATAYVRHTPTDEEPLLFEFAGQVGPAATALLATEPRPGGDASQFTGAEVWQHIGRANVGVRVPKAGTELAVGVFGTPIGYYSFWSKDNWTFSTPWHLNAVPYVLMGGRVSQPLGRKVTAQLWVTNGWQTYGDLNRIPSTMVGANYTPIDGLLLSQWVYFGADDVDNRPRAWRMLSDTYAVYDRGRWAISAIFDVARERLTALPGEPVALWLTGALTGRGRVWDSRRDRVHWDMVGRAEAFWDRDGRMYGIDQLMLSGVYGNTFTLFDHLLLRLEYRYDRSSNPDGYFYSGAAVHDDDVGLSREQHSLFFALTGYFEHAFATPRRRK